VPRFEGGFLGVLQLLALDLIPRGAFWSEFMYIPAVADDLAAQAAIRVELKSGSLLKTLGR
jgi:hypothetical protein